MFSVLAAIAAITAGVSVEEQTSTVSEAEGDFGLLFTLRIEMHLLLWFRHGAT